MSTGNDSNLVDYLTLAAAIIAPGLAAWTTIWSTKRSEVDKFSLHIDWIFFTDPDSPVEELPFLYIQNHGSNKLLITSIQWYRGAFRRSECRDTALWWEDPTDLDFPYTIEAGEVRRFTLSEEGAREQFRKVGKWAKRAGRFKGPSIWIGVTSVTGVRRFIGGERALPWNERPEWTKVRDDDEA